MGRGKVLNTMTTPEWIENICFENKELLNDFIEYLNDIGRSDTTIYEYGEDIKIAFCWSLNYLDNKSFIKWTKRDVQKYQGYLINECHLSSARVRRMKAVLSSLSNYIENILDDEYPDFRNIINKIESPPLTTTREKSVFSEEEIDNLLKTLVDRKEYCKVCLIALAAFSGRRKAELARFKVSDFDSGHLICDGALYQSDKIKTKGRGKAGKLMECYTLAKEFQPYLNLWLEYRKINDIKSEWLLCDKNGNQLTISLMNSWYDEFTEILGKDFYLHSLRHNFTTRLLKAGIPATVIQRIIGWASLDLVSHYDDSTNDETFSQYFGSEGIKKVKRKSLSDL